MINSVALTLLLGLELAYYLLIVQTGLAESYSSDVMVLAPVLIGGVIGSALSGFAWGPVAKASHKIMLALSLQLVLSFWYPDYSPLALLILGLSVGALAPLAIYLFTPDIKHELIVALGVAYVIGTYNFTTNPLEREAMAVIFSAGALAMALILWNYKAAKKQIVKEPPYRFYFLLMLWIMLDSNLFETLSRYDGLMIWRGEFTYTIIATHLLGLVLAVTIKVQEWCQHTIIALLFSLSYLISYMEIPWLLAIIYPVTISYYNVTVFRHLSIVDSPVKLGLLMVFIGWLASAAGFGLALGYTMQ